MKKINRPISFMIAVALLAGLIFSVLADDVDVVKSYYLLKYEYEGFLEPLFGKGVKESELIPYFRDIENNINLHNDVSENTIDAYVQDALFAVSVYGNHGKVSSAMMACYGDDIDEYIETGIVPESLTGVYKAVIDSLLRKDLPDKSKLVVKYEEMLSVLNNDSDKYTRAAVDEFRRKLVEGLNVLKNREVKQAEVDSAIVVLDEAYTELQKNKKQDLPDNPGNNNGNSGGGSSGGGGGSAVKPAPQITPSPQPEPVIKPEATDKPVSDKKENPVTVSAYPDVTEKYWGYKAITAMSKDGVLNGFDDGSFRPEEAVTREQFAKMIVCALKLEEDGVSHSYSDAVPGAWYNKYLAIAEKYGLMNGIGENAFGVGNTLIRQDMAIIAYRICKAGYCVPDERIPAEILPFADASEVSEYAAEYVLEAYAYGLINGMENNKLVPKGRVTRAQAAQVIYNLMGNKNLEVNAE